MPLKVSSKSAKSVKVKKQIGKPKTKDAKKKPPVLDASRIFEAAKAARTADGFDNFLSRLGLNNNNALSAGTYEFNLITRNRILLEAAYRGSWIVGKIINTIPEDMTRSGIDIQTDDDENIHELKSAASRLQINQSLSKLLSWGRLYGGAIGVVDIKGQNLATPLNLDTVAKDQFQGLIIYDRWQVNPVLQDVIDSGPDIGLPKYYQIVNNPAQLEPEAPTATGQQTVHFSRVIRNIGIELPYFQAITEMMWGMSVLEQLWDRLISFDNATMSAASLIDRANLRTVGVDGFREILAAGGAAEQGLRAQFEMMREMQVNEGLTLIDKEDTFQTTAYSFAGLSDMLLQFGQHLSGACDTPLVKLFGQSPAGLSATGESDLRMYYDGILAKQEAKLRNGWELLLKLLWRSTFGSAAPKDLQFTFVPLWQMSATDKANNAKTVTETIIGAFEAGLTTKETSLKEMRDSSSETGLFGNISDEEIQEAVDEPPPMPEEEADPNAPPGKDQDPPAAETGLNEEPKFPIGDAKPKSIFKRLLRLK